MPATKAEREAEERRILELTLQHVIRSNREAYHRQKKGAAAIEASIEETVQKMRDDAARLRREAGEAEEMAERADGILRDLEFGRITLKQAQARVAGDE